MEIGSRSDQGRRDEECIMFDGDGRMKIDCDCLMERSLDPLTYGDGGINGSALEREVALLVIMVEERQ